MKIEFLKKRKLIENAEHVDYEVTIVPIHDSWQMKWGSTAKISTVHM